MKIMKNIFLGVAACLFLTLSSCIKDDKVILEGSYVEWDAAVQNANAGGRTYPIIIRHVLAGQQQNNADPVLNSNSGVIKLRVNLVGPHRSSPITFNYKAVEGETLPANTVAAVSGTHYSMNGTVTIPANSSFGEVEITVNPASAAGNAALLVLELEGSGDVKLMETKKRIGLSIAQVAP